MSELFLKIFNTGIMAGWLVLAVLLARLVLKKAPAWTKCALWAIVGLRLIWPFELESILSLVPSAQTLPPTELTAPAPEIHTGIPYLNSAVNPAFTQTFQPEPAASVNPLQVVVFIASVVWVVGMIVMAAYAAFSYLRLRHRVSVSMPAEEGVYLCDTISSPFILGLVKPKIYLPSDLPQEQWDAILSHERAHLARRDHWWKPLGFALLTVFWFHPLLWVAYVLLCRDVELACDEKVIQSLTPDQKQHYSQTLLECSLPRKWIAACPLAFGETSVKVRIKAVLHYKKPTLWIIIAALIVCAVLAVCFLTEPADKLDEPALVTAADIYNKQYVYVGEGAGSDFYINIYENGTFQYYAGIYSSHIGLGDWELKDDKLYLYDTTLTNPMTFVFDLEENALVYIAAESFPFMYVDVADGDIFNFYSEIDPPEATNTVTRSDLAGRSLVCYYERTGLRVSYTDIFSITLYENGSCVYHDSLTSSQIHAATWYLEGDELCIRRDLGDGGFVVASFKRGEDGTFYLQRPFYGLHEGAKFELREGQPQEKHLIWVQVETVTGRHMLALDEEGNRWHILLPDDEQWLDYAGEGCWVKFYDTPEKQTNASYSGYCVQYEVTAISCWRFIKDESIREGKDLWSIYDYCLYDFDNDGILEECIISMGYTSGISTIYFSTWEDGECEIGTLMQTNHALGYAFEISEDGLTVLSSEGNRYYPSRSSTASGFG